MANSKLSMEQFCKQAITGLRNLEKSKGIHAVYSGFNGAFREYFGLERDAGIAAVNKLVAEGKLASIPRKGGPMLYLPGEKPEGTAHSNGAALKAILGAQV